MDFCSVESHYIRVVFSLLQIIESHWLPAATTEIV